MGFVGFFLLFWFVLVFFLCLVCSSALFNDLNWLRNVRECVWVLILSRGRYFGKVRSTFSLHCCYEIPNVHAVWFNGNHEVPKSPQVCFAVKHKTNLSSHWLSHKKGGSCFQEGSLLSFFFPSWFAFLWH